MKKPTDDELFEALAFMKDMGLVPTGKGKPLQDCPWEPYDIVVDYDFDHYYLHQSGNCWLIKPDGKSQYLYYSSTGYEVHPNQETFEGSWSHDYITIEAIQSIYSIIDPGWCSYDEDFEK